MEIHKLGAANVARDLMVSGVCGGHCMVYSTQ